MHCPYGDCPFEGTQAEVDDHASYMAMIEDPEHDERKRDSREVARLRRANVYTAGWRDWRKGQDDAEPSPLYSEAERLSYLNGWEEAGRS